MQMLMKKINSMKNLMPSVRKQLRHIFLIKHVQYHTNGKTDTARFLTDIGRKQAAQTGEQLQKFLGPKLFGLP